MESVSRPEEVRLLGAMEVLVGGRPLPLGHVRRRSVLAILAVEPNRVVSRDGLMHRLWGERPPESASNVLYGYIGQLRTLLSHAAQGMSIERGHGGYRLAIENEERVDMHRFHRLVERSRRESPPDAAVLLDEALGAWRGEAFAGTSSDWLMRVRHRLEDERLAAMLDRNDLILRSGRHGDRLAELRALAAHHPLNQRLIAQLMMALQKSGLAWEALAVYTRTRRRLRNEFGLDPDPRLRTLELQILSGAPTSAD